MWDQPSDTVCTSLRRQIEWADQQIGCIARLYMDDNKLLYRAMVDPFLKYRSKLIIKLRRRSESLPIAL